MKVKVQYLGYITKEVEIDDKYKDIGEVETYFPAPVEQAIRETGEVVCEVNWVGDENDITIWEA